MLLRLREQGTPGLLLSGDSQEGALLGAYRAAPQPPGRGLLVRRQDKASLVQVALSDSTG
jgi:S-DNA-T family DNA segregation ATPase FtsK/SpoIIIE